MTTDPLVPPTLCIQMLFQPDDAAERTLKKGHQTHSQSLVSR